MKHILVVFENFAPQNKISAIRLTKLVKYLKIEMNYQITVVTRKLAYDEIKDPLLGEDLKYVDEYIAVDYPWVVFDMMPKRKRFRKKEDADIEKAVLAKRNGRKKSLKMTAIMHYRAIRDKTRTKRHIKDAFSVIKSSLSKYDVMITSQGPESSGMIGLKIKKAAPHILWIMDVRDPFVKALTPKAKIKHLNKLAQEIGANADYFVGVTGPCVERFKQQGREADVRVVHNGFDRDDIIQRESDSISSFVRILYTGTITPIKDDFNPLFAALVDLITAGYVDSDKTRVEYAGKDYHLLHNTAARYGLQHICKNHGFVSRDLSLELQSECTILLMARWNNAGETEILSGKIFEYIMQDKPILALISGNLKDSKVKEIITNANSGFVYEEANKEEDFPRLKDFLLAHYRAFITGKSLEFSPDREYIEQFNWKNLAMKFADIIEGIENR